MKGESTKKYAIMRIQEYGPGEHVEGLREMCGKVVSLVMKLVLDATSHGII